MISEKCLVVKFKVSSIFFLAQDSIETRLCILKATNDNRLLKQIRKTPQMKNRQTRLTIQQVLSQMAGVDHPNVANVKDIYEDSASLYIVSEYIVGGNLYSFLDQKVEITEQTVVTLVK